jgi:glycine/D-amino acid oxidase-like deaminating enzyme
MNDSPEEFALSRYSRELWLDLAPQLRARDAFARCGTLWLAADDEEFHAARAMHAAYEAQGVPLNCSTRAHCVLVSRRLFHR